MRKRRKLAAPLVFSPSPLVFKASGVFFLSGYFSSFFLRKNDRSRKRKERKKRKKKDRRRKKKETEKGIEKERKREKKKKRDKKERKERATAFSVKAEAREKSASKCIML